ncbi:MAG: thiol:disulfide interchange protein DsbA/DsbL [Pseudomonadota bacterium]|nr:disulfide bond formation protein DsbA [Pseudomonadales bacterium]MDY6919436.1 thiol:disulfide interchange protein DsbA/DsbL [Pseudomonadota bacterium]
MKALQRVWLGLMILALSPAALAFSMERFVEGTHYEVLADLPREENKVVEFFSFGCPHCFHLEPAVEAWLHNSKPDAVTFERVPATWNSNFETLGKLYYVIEELGVADKAMPAVFAYIHEQNETISGREDAKALLTTLGVSPEAFAAAWSDEQVTSHTLQAGRVFARYKIRGVPAFVVNGRYKTSVRDAGGEQALFEVINFLLQK